MFDDHPGFALFIAIVVLAIQCIYATAVGLWLIAQFGFPITSAFLIFIIGFAFLAAMFKFAAEVIGLISIIIALIKG